MSTVSRKSHLNLILWQKAVDLAVEVYRISGTFPRSEVYGLAQQLRRAAVSIPSNIAEGAGRRTTRDFIAFLHIARGSLAEIETQLLIAQRVGAANQDACSGLHASIDEVGRILQAFINSLRERERAASSD
jgi:four helix bundle protein